MNAKKYLVAVIVVFVAYSAVAYLIHNVLLAPDYELMRETSVVRSQAEFLQRLPLLYLANLVFALAFCLIYAIGYEPGKSWAGQGLRYGLLVGTLLAPLAVAAYVAYPVPGVLVGKWIVFGYLQMVIAGLFAAVIYHFPPPPKTY